MKSFKKKVAALILMLTALTMAVPYFELNEVYASSHIYKASQMNAYSFTSSPALANKLTQVFNGNIGLYSSSSCSSQTKAPLGCSKMTGSNRFYIKNNTTGSRTFGWQCYIYANAVYNTLYNEWAGNGSSLKHSKVVIRGGSTFSYRQFVNAGVRVGAYVRTTANRDCSYNRSKAHSFVILGYNEEYVTYIDGNSDGRGLVRVNKMTWKELNRWQTTGCGRRICHVIQPTDKYFQALYGANNSSSGSSKAKVTKEVKTNTDASSNKAVTTIKKVASNGTVTPDSVKVKYSRLLMYRSGKVLSGNDVLYVQACLKYLGYNVSTNSKYDSNTAKAVKQFQKSKKISADGVIGKQTWTTLEKAVQAKKNAAKAVTSKTAKATTAAKADASKTTKTTKATTAAKVETTKTTKATTAAKAETTKTTKATTAAKAETTKTTKATTAAKTETSKTTKATTAAKTQDVKNEAVK